MKKKLLITMGCSHTEGYGCWDESTFSDNMKSAIESSNTLPFFGDSDENLNFHTDELLKQNMPFFHKNGWPMKLGKLLKVDRVVNISKGGVSNSGIVKTFFERNIHQNPYEDYDVMFVWLMTEPFRISFYIDGHVQNYMNPGTPIFDSYFREILKASERGEKNDLKWGSLNQQWSSTDPLLENVFYFKIIESICEKNNWKFLSTIWDKDLSEDFIKLYDSKNYVKNNFLNVKEDSKWKYFSKICGHMNENGHQLFAEKLNKKITSRYKFNGNNEIDIKVEHIRQ